MRDESRDDAAAKSNKAIDPRRRQFLRNSAGLGLGFVGSTILGACGGDSSDASAQQDMTGPTDADILNFALNLEYLEAEFYLAAVGSSLQDRSIGVEGAGQPGMVQGGAAVPFDTPAIQQYAREIAEDEAAHVAFLRKAIDGAGAQPVARPAIDIQTTVNGAFSQAARAAGLIGENETFDVYANENNFMLAAYIFEDVGVTAYKGASPLVSNKTFLEAAAGILAAEAYHAGLVRAALYSRGIAMPDLSLHEASVAISNARDSLDGSGDRDQGIVEVDASGNIKTATVDGEQVNKGNIVPLDGNGVAYSRSAGQVLNVVYLTAEEATMGGFFPNGVNGAISTSAMSAAMSAG